ncbi:MchC protein [Yokenella regensburgei]|uniref:MchC protein n=1 Tax=Yokenella regensburgei TaxID=158877 RepID=UPI0035B2253E
MSHEHSLYKLKENLVPFMAHPVSSSLIWCAPDVEDSQAMQHACSYVIDSTCFAPGKTFFAERYGGSGIQRNGGGARCGFDGCYQVKGIGANPLVGQGTDGRHSNGALGAIHAVYEALWGEVLSRLLPYGAVRARAVLLTDLYTSEAWDRTDGASRRALLVRDPVVRPAHFERAPYFRPQPEFASRLLHDARRVSAVIQKLPDYLPGPEQGARDAGRVSQQQRCLEGLCELARREAWQMAYCRTRYLRLTTSPSNLAMDGRLMDFNGLSSLFPGDYPDDFGYRLRITELEKEPAVLLQGLCDLCLYLGKYLFDTGFTEQAQRQVTEVFRTTFEEACYHGYLEQLGIPLTGAVVTPPLKQLVHGFLMLSARLRNPGCSEKGDSPLQHAAVALIRGLRNETAAPREHWHRERYYQEALQCFSGGIHWLHQAGKVRESNTASFLQSMEQQVRCRLQPRDSMAKARLFAEITSLIDEYGDSPEYLQQAFSDMGTRMLTWAKEALGTLPSAHYCSQLVG